MPSIHSLYSGERRGLDVMDCNMTVNEHTEWSVSLTINSPMYPICCVPEGDWDWGVENSRGLIFMAACWTSMCCVWPLDPTATNCIRDGSGHEWVVSKPPSMLLSILERKSIPPPFLAFAVTKCIYSFEERVRSVWLKHSLSHPFPLAQDPFSMVKWDNSQTLSELTNATA